MFENIFYTKIPQPDITVVYRTKRTDYTKEYIIFVNGKSDHKTYMLEPRTFFLNQHTMKSSVFDGFEPEIEWLRFRFKLFKA